MDFNHLLTADVQTGLYLPDKSDVFSPGWNYCMYTVYFHSQRSSKYVCFFTMRLRIAMRMSSGKALGHIKVLPCYLPAQKE